MIARLAQVALYTRLPNPRDWRWALIMSVVLVAGVWWGRASNFSPIELMLKSEASTSTRPTSAKKASISASSTTTTSSARPEPAGHVGYEVLKQLRVAKVKTPILILSGLAGIEDKVAASASAPTTT
jgi:hypothetical protein